MLRYDDSTLDDLVADIIENRSVEMFDSLRYKMKILNEFQSQSECYPFQKDIVIRLYSFVCCPIQKFGMFQ